MSRKKKSYLIYIAYAACVLLIVAGLISWRSCEDKNADTPLTTVDSSYSQEYSQEHNKAHEPWLDSLEIVVVPKRTKQEIIEYPGFTVSFNSKHKQPNWVAWELTRDEVKSEKVQRKEADFAPDNNVKDCPQLADYKGSGFDRGHMCPAGDMKWSLEAMQSCFLLTNMSPQANSLNSGAWKTLEEKSRQWAVRDSALIIICGPVLSDRITRTIGESKVSVPERYFKVILSPYSNPPRAIGFIMNNGKVKGGMQQAAVSVDKVESITGFDFFSSLPDDIENTIEAECNFPRWEQY